MIRKFLGTFLFTWLFLFTQVASAADIDEIKNISAKYNFTPQDVLKKLKAYAVKNNIELNADIENLNIIPQRYYIDEKMNVHFIFAGYEISTKLKYYDFVDLEMTH